MISKLNPVLSQASQRLSMVLYDALAGVRGRKYDVDFLSPLGGQLHALQEFMRLLDQRDRFGTHCLNLWQSRFLDDVTIPLCISRRYFNVMAPDFEWFLPTSQRFEYRLSRERLRKRWVNSDDLILWQFSKDCRPTFRDVYSASGLLWQRSFDQLPSNVLKARLAKAGLEIGPVWPVDQVRDMVQTASVNLNLLNVMLGWPLSPSAKSSEAWEHFADATWALLHFLAKDLPSRFSYSEYLAQWLGSWQASHYATLALESGISIPDLRAILLEMAYQNLVLLGTSDSDTISRLVLAWLGTFRVLLYDLARRNAGVRSWL